MKNGWVLFSAIAVCLVGITIYVISLHLAIAIILFVILAVLVIIVVVARPTKIEKPATPPKPPVVKSELSAELSDIALGAKEQKSDGKITILGALCFLVVTIRNSGEPCGVEKFSLTALLPRTPIFPQGAVIAGHNEVIPEQLNTVNLRDISQTLYGVDDLGNKTMQPIAKGAVVRGRMLFVFPYLHPDAFLVKGMCFHFEMKDAFGRRCSTTAMTGQVRIADQLTHFHGLTPSPKSPHKPPKQPS